MSKDTELSIAIGVMGIVGIYGLWQWFKEKFGFNEGAENIKKQGRH